MESFRRCSFNDCWMALRSLLADLFGSVLFLLLVSLLCLCRSSLCLHFDLNTNCKFTFVMLHSRDATSSPLLCDSLCAFVAIVFFFSFHLDVACRLSVLSVLSLSASFDLICSGLGLFCCGVYLRFFLVFFFLCSFHLLFLLLLRYHYTPQSKQSKTNTDTNPIHNKQTNR